MEASSLERLSASATPSTVQGDFGELEEKVQRAVTVLRQERTARERAEADLHTVRIDLEGVKMELEAAQAQIAALTGERDTVRLRVEKVLHQLDGLIE